LKRNCRAIAPFSFDCVERQLAAVDVPDPPIGTFTYEALTLANPGDTSGLVVQIPDRS
jgi:hypothetical protein